MLLQNEFPQDHENAAASGQRVGLLPFYVYELSDPDTGKVFYVGKGQNKRILAHGQDLEDDVPEGDAQESPKNRRIREIQGRGKDVRRTIIGRYESESEAFAVESTLIKWVYGFENLTNKVHGHRSDSIRMHGVGLDVVPGIDLELSRGEQTGEYTEKGLTRLAYSSAPALLHQFRQLLGRAGYSTRDFAIRGEGAFNPGVGSGQTSCLVGVANIDCVLLVPANVDNSKVWIATTDQTRIFGLNRLIDVGATPWNTTIRGQRRYIKLPSAWNIPQPVTANNVISVFKDIERKVGCIA